MDMPSQWTKLDGVNSIYDIYMGLICCLYMLPTVIGRPIHAQQYNGLPYY